MLGRKSQKEEEARSSEHSTGMSQAWKVGEHLYDLCRCALYPGEEAPQVFFLKREDGQMRA